MYANIMTVYDPTMTTFEQPSATDIGTTTEYIVQNMTIYVENSEYGQNINTSEPKDNVPKVICSQTARWQHDVATVTIFIAWLELMMILGRFPTFGLYVQMFTTGWWTRIPMLK